jgi:hypothetical protein
LAAERRKESEAFPEKLIIDKIFNFFSPFVCLGGQRKFWRAFFLSEKTNCQKNLNRNLNNLSCDTFELLFRTTTYV